MFQVGDYIIYGSNGVCKVEEIGPIKIGGVLSKREYYFLLPIYIKGTMVYTPVDSDKTVMRPVISKEAAHELISQIDQIEPIKELEDREREFVYRKLMKTYDCKELIKIIKTISIRKKFREEEGKKLIAADEKYLNLAKDCIAGELSIPLQMKREEVEEFILQKID